MATAMRTAKKQQVEIGKTTTLHMHHAFLYIIFFAITAGLQSENSYFFFTFDGGRNHKTMIFFFFL